MRYMKLSGLGLIVFALGAMVVFGQGNQEAANLTREGIEASKAKDGDKTLKLDPNNQDAQQRKRFLDAKLHAPPTAPPMPSGPIPNPNVRPSAAATATPATKR